MQSIFRLPWSSEPYGASKVVEKAAFDKMGAPTLVEFPGLARLKRKYSGSNDDASPQQPPPQAKKPRCDTAIVQRDFSDVNTLEEYLPAQWTEQHVSSSLPTPLTTPTTFTARGLMDCGDVKSPMLACRKVLPSLPANHYAMKASSESLAVVDHRTQLEQTIENELNVQILMKHGELRFIEQELAKCQIALEQLRRCELRPFPGGEHPSLQHPQHLNAAITPGTGLSQPSHAPPFGVADGPYSHHYRQWLLHDPKFDSVGLHELAQFESQADARSTRHNGQAKKYAGKSVVHSSRRTDSMNSIPNYPSHPPKDKSAPLVLRRSTDNQLVKLICNNCLRGNFSSIQGFLNHCRIAHKVDYKSHDLAAIDCGRPLDEIELANLPAENQAPSAPKPAVSRINKAHSTPARVNNLIHPLNTIAASPVAIPRHAPPAPAAPARGLTALPAGEPVSTPLKTSSQVPRLSQLFAKHNFGGDLEQAVTAARQKIDFEHEEPWSPDVSQYSSPVAAIPGARTVAAHRPSGLGESDANARPSSRKGFRQPKMHRPRPTPLMPAQGMDTELSPHDSPSTTFSPHAPESEPGLVSDHEDDENGSASEEEAPHAEIPHPLPVGRHCSDTLEIDVEEDGGLDEHRVIIRRSDMFAPEARGVRNAGSPSRK